MATSGISTFLSEARGSVIQVESMEVVISHFVYPSLMLDNFPSNNYVIKQNGFSVDKYCVLSKF